MKTTQISSMAAFLFAALLVLPGCTPSDQPDLGRVSGTVTLDGDPLVGVSVVFLPDEGRPSSGVTDAKGMYELTYIRTTRGAKVGNHRVEIGGGEGSGEEDSDSEPENPDSQPQAAPKPKQSNKPVIPAKYNSKSELKEEVKAGNNTINFALTSS